MELACNARQPTAHIACLPTLPNVNLVSISTGVLLTAPALFAMTSLIVGVAAVLITPNVDIVNKGMP